MKLGSSQTVNGRCTIQWKSVHAWCSLLPNLLNQSYMRFCNVVLEQFCGLYNGWQIWATCLHQILCEAWQIIQNASSGCWWILFKLNMGFWVTWSIQSNQLLATFMNSYMRTTFKNPSALSWLELVREANQETFQYYLIYVFDVLKLF